MKLLMTMSMILLACSTVIHAESSVVQEVDALVGAKDLNGLVRVCEEAMRGGEEDRRARLCTTIMGHVKSGPLPNTFKAELLTLVVRFGGAESVDDLSALLSHEDPVLNTRAVLGLQQNPSESAAVALRKALAEASEPGPQAVFVHALAERGDAASLPHFVKFAESKDTQVRKLALHAVALTSEKPLNALFQAAISQDSKTAGMDSINAYLAHADRLGEIGKKREAAAIYRELVALGGFQKGSALTGLALVGGAGEIGAILDGLKGANQRDLAALDRIFAPIPPARQVIEKVCGRTAGADPNLKAGLLGVLGSYADPASLDTVLTAAGDTNDLVRKAALAALGQFDEERAAETLVTTVLSGQDGEIAAQSLENSPGISKIAGKLKKALPGASAPVRVLLVRLLGNCPKAECVPVLLEALKDADIGVRAEALGALARAGDPASFARIVEFLAGEPDQKVRANAVAALSALVDAGGVSTQGLKLVVGRLMKGDCPGRAELIAVLPKVCSASSRESGLKLLVEALGSRDEKVRRAAIRAMQEWPDPDVVLAPLLLAAGKGPDSLDGVLALRAYIKQLERLAGKHSIAVREGRMSDQDARKEMVQHYRKGLDVAVTQREKRWLQEGLSRQGQADE